MRSSLWLFPIVIVNLTSLHAEENRAKPQWKKVAVEQTGSRLGAMLVSDHAQQKMYLVGETKNAPFVQKWDVQEEKWSEQSPNNPAGKEVFQAAYQTVLAAPEGKIYCLSSDPMKPQSITLYVYLIEKNKWDKIPVPEEVASLAWHTMTFETQGNRLVILGATKKGNQVGWTQTWFFDTRKQTWSILPLPDRELQQRHQNGVARREGLIDLVGRIRLAWYRDPNGQGTEAERQGLLNRIKEYLANPLYSSCSEKLADVQKRITEKKLLEALTATRNLQRQMEEQTEADYPVPSSRRNSPLVYDAQHHVCVLFAGDHEDYLLNDTWILDLKSNQWRRLQPPMAPRHRAGHALVYLPKSGRIALYGGYQQNTSEGYGSRSYRFLEPELWLFDVKGEKWEALDTWPLPNSSSSSTKEAPEEFPFPLTGFHGYYGQFYAPPALGSTHDDRLILANPDTREHSGGGWKRPAITWIYSIDSRFTSADLTKKLGTTPHTRWYRGGSFSAGYCEVETAPNPLDFTSLEANRWIKFPNPPKNPCQGCRQRDWGTAVWDSDRSQILLWGGGHCVRASSSVVHFSPYSGRMVESYDADEPYGTNGLGGYGSTLWNRPWCDVHNYKHYAYDPKCQLMVSHRGYLYDPERMDWLRQDPYPIPFRPEWSHTALCSTPHGVVAWARKKNGEDGGLWLFDKQKGWQDLEPVGKLFVPYCDSHGLVYDSKRDRLVLSGVGGAYNTLSKGQFLAFDFKTKKIETLTPENIEYNKTDNAREMAYVEHLDWIIIGRRYLEGDEKTGKQYTRIYDCANNKMILLDAGPVPDSGGYGAGWMYDAQSKLVYVLNFRGEAFVIKLKP